MIEHEIEVVCQAESLTVGAFTTSGKLGAAEIHTTLTGRDAKRFPVKIVDGEPLMCLHCKLPLYFRNPEGESFVGVPGTLEVNVSPEEVARRIKAAKKNAVEEAAAEKRRQEQGAQ